MAYRTVLVIITAQKVDTEADIEGFMPKNISLDGGKTWQVTKSSFSRLGSGQRPSLIKLSSGRLFYTADLRAAEEGYFGEPLPKPDQLPKGYTSPGGYVGLSNDNGQTWRVKKADRCRHA